MPEHTAGEKRQIVEATVMILVSWAFWFAMGFAVGVSLFPQGNF